MKQKSKPIKEQTECRTMLITRHYFTTDQKHGIINEYLGSKMTKQEIWEKYTGQEEEHGQILEWMRKLGYTDKSTIFEEKKRQMKQKKTSEVSDESFENLRLKKRIEELEKQLRDAEMKAVAFSTMVDIAEKEFNIQIRKKFNTKPSKK